MKRIMGTMLAGVAVVVITAGTADASRTNVTDGSRTSQSRTNG